MNNPYRTPNAVLAETTFNTSDTRYEPAMFATQGRIGRLRYLTYSFWATFMVALVLGIVAAVIIPLSGNSAKSGTLGMAAIGIIYIPILALTFIMAKRRLNDLDHSGWYALLMLVPLVNLFFSLYLVFWPGSPGSNSYGPKPVKNSLIVIIFGLILPLALVGVLAAVALPAYQSYVERAQQAGLRVNP